MTLPNGHIEVIDGHAFGREGTLVTVSNEDGPTKAFLFSQDEPTSGTWYRVGVSGLRPAVGGWVETLTTLMQLVEEANDAL
jgi:hypothetical protein